jgi:hypothetical protein
MGSSSRKDVETSSGQKVNPKRVAGKPKKSR